MSAGSRLPGGRRWIALVAIAALSVAACSSSDENGTSSAAADGVSEGDMIVHGVWARPSPGGGTTTAIYLTIDNTGDQIDTLVAAQSPACEVAELHMTTTEDGVMRMAPVTDGIAVPPGTEVVLGPGGLHIMCLGVATPLNEGDETEITVDFVRAGSLTAIAKVRNDEG